MLAQIQEQMKALIADQEEIKARMTALESRTPQAPQSDPPITRQQSNSPAKKKRDQKTRLQYKKKAQAQAIQRVTTVQVQEVDQVKEMEHSAPSSVIESGKHVFLQRTMVPWVHRCWHAAIQSDWMIDGMIMVGCGTNRMRRLGVG